MICSPGRAAAKSLAEALPFPPPDSFLPPRSSACSARPASCRRPLRRSTWRATCAPRLCPPALLRSPQHLPTGTAPPSFSRKSALPSTLPSTILSFHVSLCLSPSRSDSQIAWSNQGALLRCAAGLRRGRRLLRGLQPQGPLLTRFERFSWKLLV